MDVQRVRPGGLHQLLLPKADSAFQAVGGFTPSRRKCRVRLQAGAIRPLRCPKRTAREGCRGCDVTVDHVRCWTCPRKRVILVNHLGLQTSTLTRCIRSSGYSAKRRYLLATVLGIVRSRACSGLTFSKRFSRNECVLTISATIPGGRYSEVQSQRLHSEPGVQSLDAAGELSTSRAFTPQCFGVSWRILLFCLRGKRRGALNGVNPEVSLSVTSLV